MALLWIDWSPHSPYGYARDVDTRYHIPHDTAGAAPVLSPKTGQEDMMYVYWLIAFAALAGAGVCARNAGKNRKSAR